MAKDKKKTKALNSSDCIEILVETIKTLKTYYEKQLEKERELISKVKEQWARHYAKMMLFMLISGIILGFIVGVILFE